VTAKHLIEVVGLLPDRQVPHPPHLVLQVLRIPGQGGRDSEIDSVAIPKLIRSRFREEVGQGFRF
jgi:hypothetical protein